MTDPTSRPDEVPSALARRLGAFDATTILVGSMIGSGIFVAPSIMAGWIAAPGLLLALWIFGGVFTALGALAFAELSTMFPRAGGQYIYLREAFGPFSAFLFGWTLLLVIQTGFIAAVSIAFAKFLGFFFTSLGERNILVEVALTPSFALRINSAQAVATLVILILSGINVLGVGAGALVQNVFTVAKVLALACIIVVGFAKFGGETHHFSPLLNADVGPLAVGKATFSAALAVALSKALFAYDAWNTVTFVSEEVRAPERTLPRALVGGSLLVTLVYVMTNAAYLLVLPSDAMARVVENKVGEEVAVHLFGGAGVAFVVVAILISTFGCVNGLILGGARVAYAMAREGLFFRSCSELHAVRRTPVGALVVQGVWASVLTLSGSYDALLTYTTFASVLFSVLTVLALFWLRRARPEAPRPYRCWGYPITPGLYLLIALPFLVYVIQGDPVSTGLGLLLIATGVPAYWRWRSPRRDAVESTGGTGH